MRQQPVNKRVGPLTLASLPTEVLTNIAHHLSRSSAISLACVARRFVLPAEHRIWRQLDLFLHPNFGEYPLVQPYGRAGYGAHYEWAKEEAREAEERHRIGLRDKVKRITIEGSGRRFEMVQKVVVIPRPGAITGILALLDVVSPNLTQLEIDAPAPHIFRADWRPVLHETLDFQILHCSISFPSLTHLRIHKHSLRIVDFLILLCNASPNLISLDADVQHGIAVADWDHPMIPAPVTQLRDSTNLRYLRLAFSDIAGKDFHPAVEIIAESPALRQLSLEYTTADQGMTSRIMTMASELEYLQDLHVPVDLNVFMDQMEEWGGEEFPSLRRLVLTQSQPLEFVSLQRVRLTTQLENLPFLPELQSIYLQQSSDAIPGLPAPTAFAAAPQVTSMLPDFADIIRRTYLRTFHFLPKLVNERDLSVFDQIDKLDSSPTTCNIRSLCNGDDELLHARLLLRHYEKSDTVRPAVRLIGPGEFSFEYTARDGSERDKVYQTRPDGESGWVDITDFEGFRVPIEVIETMRVAEGAKIGDWEGRRIEVGDAAWAVLTGWRDRQVVEEACRAKAEERKNQVKKRTIVISSTP